MTTTLDPDVQHRVPLRRDLPGRGPSRRAGPPGPGRRAARQGLAHNPDRWQYLYDIGLRLLLVAAATTGGAAHWFERAPRGAGLARVAAGLAAITLAQGGDRRRSRFLWQRIRDDRRAATTCGRRAERRLQQLDVADEIDALNDALGTRTPRGPATRPPRGSRCVARAGCPRATGRSGGHAVHHRPRAPGRVGAVARVRAAPRCRPIRRRTVAPRAGARRR